MTKRLAQPNAAPQALAALKQLPTAVLPGQPSDTYEQDADRLAATADAPVAAPESVAHTPAAPTPIAHTALPTSGQPLDDTTRAQLEPRLGHNFADVRVHSDPRAADSARMLGARAYTIGRDVVFGAGEYQPGNSDGRRLLAHELAHVAQQRTHGAMVQRKEAEKPPAPKWYQELIDRVGYVNDEAKKRQASGGGFYPEPLGFDSVRAALRLCEAIDQERKAAIPALIDDFAGKDSVGTVVSAMSEPLFHVVTSRLYLMGLRAESEKLRKHYDAHVKENSFADYGIYGRWLAFWNQVTNDAIGKSDLSTPENAAAGLDAITLAFTGPRDEYLKLDQEAVERDRRYGPTSMRLYTSIWQFSEGLIRILQRLAVAVQTTMQALVDGAVADLEAGKGDARLVLARNTLEQKVKPIVYPADTKQSINWLELDMTRSTLDKGVGRHQDVFLEGKAAEKRSVKFTLYDATKDWVAEKRLTIARLYDVRSTQLELLAKLFGGRSADGKVSDEAKANAAVISQMPGKTLGLNSNDDWREFVLLKYESLAKTTDKATALVQVIKLLEEYLYAFTWHTPYNIEDIKTDNYLTAEFPRALSGQLIHDCGVYALRIAYILSLVRDKLDLRFRFVSLPVHLALVISGKDLPLIVAHNNNFSIFSQKDVADAQTGWKEWKEKQKRSDPDNPLKETTVNVKPAGPTDETQFIGELAAQSFIHGPIDMPFKVVDVPNYRGSNAAIKSQLWEFYKSNTVGELFGPESRDPKSDLYQFHLRYLAMLEEYKALFNRNVVPFWNEKANARWTKFKERLIYGTRTDSMRAGDLATWIDEYQLALGEDYKVVKEALDSLDSRKRYLTGELREHPRLKVAGVRIANGIRMADFYYQGWKKDYQEYIKKLDSTSADLSRQAKPGEKETPADQQVHPTDQLTNLAPPFLPEKLRLEPFDL